MEIIIYILLVLSCLILIRSIISKCLYIKCIKNSHKHIIKQACKDGNFNKLVKNCKEVVNDYIAWKHYNELKYFYIKECYLTVFAKTFCEAYKILKYLERADIYRKYQKLNSIYVNKKNNESR